MSEFKIEVREKPYRTRAGEKVYVINFQNDMNYPFDCSDSRTRLANGMVWGGYEAEHDIIGDWEDQPATAALPDRMEVWLRFAAEIVSTAIPRGGFMDFPIDDCAKFAGKLADAMTAEYERRKGGGK